MAEKEYIERNNVISHKRPFTEFDEGGWSCKVQAVAVEDIQNIPAADVVEVVRCKDCKHYAGQPDGCMLLRTCVHENFYCEYGEREEIDNG